MNFDNYDFLDTSKFAGKIILTSFPGLIENTRFDISFFLKELKIFKDNNCSSITSFVEDSEFEKICDKKNFVEQIYHNKLKWYHLPIRDLGAPNTEFKFKWETTKVLLKNELIEGKNIVLHCRGGKGRAGTVAALLLIDFGVKKEEAIQLVRSRRKGAIETKEQEEFIFSYRPVA
jgi:ADP-ribosyl-[dinitrogen reductase] hydrolase